MDSKTIKPDDVLLIKEAIELFIDGVKNDYIVKPFLDDPRFSCYHSPWLEDWTRAHVNLWRR